MGVCFLVWDANCHYFHAFRFGDICPGETGIVGRIFLTVLPLFGLGFFCGPILDLASSWQNMVPGGVASVGSVTLALGVVMLTTFEDLSISEAIHLCIITGEFFRIMCTMKVGCFVVPYSFPTIGTIIVPA